MLVSAEMPSWRQHLCRGLEQGIPHHHVGAAIAGTVTRDHAAVGSRSEPGIRC